MKTLIASRQPSRPSRSPPPPTPKTVRLPETGDPAFVIATPDDWTHHVNGSGNLVALSAKQSAQITFSRSVNIDGTLEELAAGRLESCPTACRR